MSVLESSDVQSHEGESKEPKCRSDKKAEPSDLVRKTQMRVADIFTGRAADGVKRSNENQASPCL